MSLLTGSEPCPKCRVLLNWQAHIADRYIPNARVYQYLQSLIQTPIYFGPHNFLQIQIQK